MRLINNKVFAMRRTIEERIGYWGYDVLSIADGNDLIAQLLKSAEPAAICPGSATGLRYNAESEATLLEPSKLKSLEIATCYFWKTLAN